MAFSLCETGGKPVSGGRSQRKRGQAGQDRNATACPAGSPETVQFVLAKDRVVRDEGQVFLHRLGSQQPVKGIAMVEG